jgi:hypothetical protein
MLLFFFYWSGAKSDSVLQKAVSQFIAPCADFYADDNFSRFCAQVPKTVILSLKKLDCLSLRGRCIDLAFVATFFSTISTMKSRRVDSILLSTSILNTTKAIFILFPADFLLFPNFI